MRILLLLILGTLLLPSLASAEELRKIEGRWARYEVAQKPGSLPDLTHVVLSVP